MEDLLFVEKERRGDVGILTAWGDVDMATVRPLREAVREMTEGGAVHLILDLRGVGYVDSSGVSVVMAAKKFTGLRHGKVYVVLRPGETNHALKLVKAHHLAEMADTPEEALKALGG